MCPAVPGHKRFSVPHPAGDLYVSRETMVELCHTRGCTKAAASRGWCWRCYKAWLSYGDASLPVSGVSMVSTHPDEAWDLHIRPRRNYEIAERWAARYPGPDPMRLAQMMLWLLRCGGCGHEQPFPAPEKPAECACRRPVWKRGKCRKCYYRGVRGLELFYDEIMPDEPCSCCGAARWAAA